MNSFLISIGKRVLVGLAISLLGVIISFVTSNWQISISWFGVLGLIIITVGGLLGPSRYGNPWGPRTQSGNLEQSARQTYADRSRAMSLLLSMFFVGVPIVLVSFAIYSIMR